MANETWKFVQAKSRQAMKQVLGIKDEAAHMKVTPPLAVTPLAHGDDMRWNPDDDGIYFNPQAQRYLPSPGSESAQSAERSFALRRRPRQVVA